MTELSTVINHYDKHRQSIKNNFVFNISTILSEWTVKRRNIISSKTKDIEDLINTCIIVNTKTCYSSLNFKDIGTWHKMYLIDSEQHRKDGHNFNIFELLRNEFDFRIQETMHSKLIKFLLDSNGSHGQGKRFLIEFLKQLNAYLPEEGVWHITAEEGKIDVLLQRNEPESIIIIENKSNWACDQPNQLYRYWYNAIYLKTKEKTNEFYAQNKDRYQIIYLPPNNYKTYEEQSVRKPQDDLYNSYIGLPDKVPVEVKILTFDSHIQDWLEMCKRILPETNHRIKEYITQYQILCKTL